MHSPHLFYVKFLTVSMGDEKHNIQKMALGSIANFIREINKNELPPNHIRFFRGQESINWELLPSLYRNRKFVDNEIQIYHEIISKCPDDFNNCHSDFEKMVKMQHYGIPTRLLDITTNVIAALFFACNSSSQKGNAVVYSFDVPISKVFYFDSQDVKNKISIESPNKSLSNNKVFCIIPKLSNPRIIRQNGAFFFYGDNDVDLTTIFSTHKYELSKSHKKHMREQLRNMGINSSQFFPEMECVSKDIKEKYLN